MRFFFSLFDVFEPIELVANEKLNGQIYMYTRQIHSTRHFNLITSHKGSENQTMQSEQPNRTRS